MNLKDAENAIVEEFSMYEEWLDKYEYLIELGKSLQDYPEAAKTDDKLIKGCQSRVWLDYRMEEGRIVFNADSDAIITKGIISLLIGLYSERTPAEILSSDFSVVEKIGLKENLSPTRANGLVSMIAKIRQIASDNCWKMPDHVGHDDIAGLTKNVIVGLTKNVIAGLTGNL